MFICVYMWLYVLYELSALKHEQQTLYFFSLMIGTATQWLLMLTLSDIGDFQRGY